MNLQMQPILAVDLLDVAVYGIGAIFVVGSWIVNILQKQAKARKAQERRLSMRSGASTETQLDADDIDSIAAKRRAQLREMARQRMQQGGKISASTSTEPGNMTMAERVARARAKARYEERAKALAQSRESSGRRDTQADTDSRKQYQAELQRRKASAKAREQAQRQADIQQEREEAMQRAQSERKRQQRLAQQAAAARRDREEALQRAREERGSRRSHKNPAGHVHQLFADAPMTTTRKRRSHALRRTLSGKSLKAAIMVKEVLDAPVALRTPVDEKSL